MDGSGKVPFDDYPGVYSAADAASVALRRQHFLAEGVQLLLNPVSAGLVLLVATGVLRLSSAVLTAVSTTLLVVMLWVVRASRWQKRWYECRGSAEDVKRLSWRYMMELDPFPPGAPVPEASFVRLLDDMVRGHPEIAGALGRGANAFTPPVTDGMRRVRQAPSEERARIYVESRLRPERAWYAAKAARYAAADDRWFAFLVAVQLAAVASAMFLAVRIGASPAPSSAAESAIPLIAATGAAVMGWQRSKRYADLASSYASTAHALAGLESTRPGSEESALLGEWVEAVESTLASEHEVWRLMT
ncbi:MAG TPA: DUF4231 domain-containing protein [Anaeromyxobacteraceae bacterium]|nr:DUF4231 domain-containing protein [Anaeromyxobacteraceae bacterium]